MGSLKLTATATGSCAAYCIRRFVALRVSSDMKRALEGVSQALRGPNVKNVHRLGGAENSNRPPSLGFRSWARCLFVVSKTARSDPLKAFPHLRLPQITGLFYTMMITMPLVLQTAIALVWLVSAMFETVLPPPHPLPHRASSVLLSTTSPPPLHHRACSVQRAACLTRAGEVRRRVDDLRGHLTPKVVHSSPDLPRLSYGSSAIRFPCSRAAVAH